MTIIVTGVGAVTALGRTARETFDRVIAGERAFRDLSLFDPGEVRSRLVAEVPSVTVSADPAVSRTSELLLLAAREAIAEARLDVRTRRVGLVLGGSTAGMFETESILATLLLVSSDEERRAVRDDALSRMLGHPLSAPTDRLAAELGPFVRVRSLSSACSSGANALLVGAIWLELGLVDAVVCGAADSLCRVIVSGFNALGAVDPEGARPFDVRRRGLTLGEGAGMVVLERAGRDRKRALCTLLGWASRSEAHHITNPDASGTAPFEAMQAALRRAGLRTSDIDYVNAHGTGTSLNDVMETRALTRLFGDDRWRVPVSSQKGMFGHTLAAAGAIGAVLTALAIERGVILPTGGLEEPDPACALRHVKKVEARPIRAAIASSFGFGGMDTALVLGHRERSSPPRPSRAVVITGMSVVTPAGILSGTDVADLPTHTANLLTVTLPDDALDGEKARRLDRASRLGAVACGLALGEGVPSSARAPTASPSEAGLVLGISFGAVDSAAKFMRRFVESGARRVPPADFPSLVPSSPAGHVSIYLGLTGPAFVVADLAASGECAFAQACELISAGEVDRMCAGAVEERSVIVEDVMSIVFGESTRADVARREGSAAVALARADAGFPALARVGKVLSWRDGDAHGLDPQALLELEAPPPGAVVVLSGASERAATIALGTRWKDCRRVVCKDACGAHEAAGGIAIAVAAANVARGDASAALFVGSARGWAYAGTVWPLEPST